MGSKTRGSRARGRFQLTGGPNVVLNAVKLGLAKGPQTQSGRPVAGPRFVATWNVTTNLGPGWEDLILGLLQQPSSLCHWLHRSSRYYPRRAASAASASCWRTAKNSFDWPMNSPSSVKALSAPMAAPFVSVGRMIETGGNVRRRKMVGSGMIRLLWTASGAGATRFGNINPLVGSVTAGALPALSCQV